MFDLTPLYRSTVGFDRLFNALDSLHNGDTAPTYPPYNIERLGDDEYRITMAVAGFGEGDAKVLHQGIAARSFERRFQLADHVEVKGAGLENGLLHIDLKRELPEAMKPRSIAISGKKQIEGKKAA